jgi:hypothetical protein
MEKAVESMEMTLGAIPHPGRVPEQRLLSPEIGLRWRWRCATFHGRRLDYIGFSRRRDFIGRRAMSEGGQEAHTTPWRGQRGGRHQVVWLPPGPPLSLLWTLSHVEKNRNFGLHFIQFREYFLCNFSKTKKTAENRNWHYGILLIG